MRYGFTALLRNKGRTAGLIIVVVIAVAMFSGISIATASLTSYQVQKSMGDVVIDLRVSSEIDDPRTIESIIETVKDDYPLIEKAIPITFQDLYYDLIINATGGISWDALNASNFNYTLFDPKASLVGVNQGDLMLPRLQGIIKVTNGSYPGNNQSIMVDENTATRYNLTVGMNLSVGTFFWGYPTHYTREVNNLTITGTFTILDPVRLTSVLSVPYKALDNNIYVQRSAAGLDVNQTIIWADFASMRDIQDILLPDIDWEFFHLGYYCINIIIDHSSINVLDISASKETLLKIANVIYSRGGITYDLVISEDLYQVIADGEEFINGLRTILLLLAIPPLFIGLYLAITLSDQTVERRIPEIGHLKSKGARNRQIAGWFFTENVLVGAIGGALGYIAGFGTCFIFLAAELQKEFPAFLGMNLVHSDWFSLIISIALGVGVCAISVIDPIRRLNKIPVVDVTKKQLNYSTYKPWKSRADVSALVAGAVPLVWMGISTNVSVDSLPYMFQSIFLLMSQVMTGVSLLASFFLTYGLIKIIAGRSPQRFSRIAQGVAKIFSRKSAWLIGRNVGGRPRQSGGLVFILALTVSMGILLPIVKASEDAFEEDLARAMVGADLRVNLNSNQWNASSVLANQFINFSPDITRATPIVGISAAYTHGSPSDMFVCGINASEYPLVIRYDGSYITTGSPDETFARLGSTPNGTFLLEPWAQTNGYSVGDPIIIHFYGMGLMSFVVEGLFSILPGMVRWGDGAQAVVNLDYLQAHNLTTEYFFYHEVLVRMVDHPSIGASELARQLKDHFTDDIWYITTFADAILGIQEGSSFSGFSLISLTKLFDIEFAFILVIATAGVAIIIYRGASDRRREIATLRARGMEFKELFKLQAGEGITLVLLGLILGCLGILIAYTINVQIAQAFYTFITIARPFVLPPAMFLQLGLTFGILVAVVLFVNWREVKRTDIPKIGDTLRIY